MKWALLPYKRYFDFSGRSTRQEYWLFALFTTVVMLALFLLSSIGGDSNAILLWDSFFIIALGVFWLASFIPALAVTVRRFHDQDRSGWFILLNFIPFIGGLIVFVFMVLPGTAGPNRFGLDPRRVNEVFV